MHGHGKNLTHLQSILLFKDSSTSYHETVNGGPQTFVAAVPHFQRIEHFVPVDKLALCYVIVAQ
jgi:hypothetical protein